MFAQVFRGSAQDPDVNITPSGFTFIEPLCPPRDGCACRPRSEHSFLKPVHSWSGHSLTSLLALAPLQSAVLANVIRCYARKQNVREFSLFLVKELPIFWYVRC